MELHMRGWREERRKAVSSEASFPSKRVPVRLPVATYPDGRSHFPCLFHAMGIRGFIWALTSVPHRYCKHMLKTGWWLKRRRRNTALYPGVCYDLRPVIIWIIRMRLKEKLDKEREYQEKEAYGEAIHTRHVFNQSHEITKASTC